MIGLDYSIKSDWIDSQIKLHSSLSELEEEIDDTQLHSSTSHILAAMD